LLVAAISSPPEVITVHHKEPPASLGGLRVVCDQAQCVFYEADPQRERGKCQCKHPDKKHHLNQKPCPLYRMNWSKSKLMDMF